MSLTIGNTQFRNDNPGASSYTREHIQNTGDDRGLLVSICHSSTTTVTGVTYGGDSMVAVNVISSSSISQYMSSWFLEDPPTGANDVVVTFNTNQWNSSSFAFYSFTGCGGVGSKSVDTDLDETSSHTISCSENSLIFCRAQSFQAAGSPGIVIDGTTYNAVNMDFQHNTNSQAWGKLGTNKVTAGNRTITAVPTFGGCISEVIEIKESGGVVVTPRYFFIT